MPTKAIGKTKQAVGKAVGSDRLEAEAVAQEIKGDAQRATGEAKKAVKDVANRAADAVNKNLQTLARMKKADRQGGAAFDFSGTRYRVPAFLTI